MRLVTNPCDQPPRASTDDTSVARQPIGALLVAAFVIVALLALVIPGFAGDERPEQTISLIIDSRREEQCSAWAGRGIVAKTQTP